MKKSVVAVLTILLVACSGINLGSLGDILGSTGRNSASDVRGTVVRVDTNERRIDLDVSTVNNLQDQRRGSSIYYDSETVVEYQNRNYRPEDLERGDEISVRGANREGRYVAERITVVRDVS